MSTPPQKSNLAGFYDTFYEGKLNQIYQKEYDETFYKKVPGSHYEVAIGVLEPLLAENTDTPWRSLELGIGTGAMLQWMTHRGVQAQGVDISEVLVKQQQSLGLKAQRHDLNEGPLPFVYNQFDIFLSLDVIEHVIDPIFFMTEAFRVLKPGGHLVISTANSRTFKALYILAVKGTFPWTSEEGVGWDCGHLHYFTSRDILNLSLKSGFEKALSLAIPGYSAGKKAMLKRLLYRVLPQAFSREFLAGNFLIYARKPATNIG